jgi:predicted RNA polymerase sigma factor
VYLVFNEGYSAGTTGAELSREAIRLGRLLVDLLPEPEVMGLIGLMLLQESRRAARSSPEGDLILLDQQDRSLWDRDQIAEGIRSPKTFLHRAVSVLTPGRRPLRQFMPRLPRRHLLTGARSHCSTTG